MLPIAGHHFLTHLPFTRPGSKLPSHYFNGLSRLNYPSLGIWSIFTAKRLAGCSSTSGQSMGHDWWAGECLQLCSGSSSPKVKPYVHCKEAMERLVCRRIRTFCMPEVALAFLKRDTSACCWFVVAILS